MRSEADGGAGVAVTRLKRGCARQRAGARKSLCERRGNRIVAMRPERMAARQAARTKPRATDQPMPCNGFRGVVRAGRHEATRAGEPGRAHELIRANQGERCARRHAGGGQVRGAARVSERPARGGRRTHARDWNRAHREIRGEGQQRCRGQQLVCGFGTTRGSNAWRGCESPRRQSCESPPRQAARDRWTFA